MKRGFGNTTASKRALHLAAPLVGVLSQDKAIVNRS